MKNLLHNIEGLEELPSHARMRECDNPARGLYNRYHNRYDYPWKRVWRFLTSNVGEHWDDVYSKYCKLDWVPKRYKNVEKISDTVILNTFSKNGKVYYYENCRYNVADSLNNERRIEDHYRECFYIDPTTKVLCFRQAKQKNNDTKSKLAKTFRVLGPYHQLLKLNGVWHEIKGEPVKNDKIIEIDGLHYELIDTIKPVKRFYVHGGIVYNEINVPPQYKNHKIIDGKVYVPYVYSRYSEWDEERLIGPNDRMIEDYAESSWTSPYWNRKNYRSVRLTLRRQLNRKDLKKYGLQNDKEKTGPICKKCGGIAGKHCFHSQKEIV